MAAVANPENIIELTVRYPDETTSIVKLTEGKISVPPTQVSYCIREKKISIENIEAEGDSPDIALKITSGKDEHETEFTVYNEKNNEEIFYRFNLANEKWCGVKVGKRSQKKKNCANSNKTPRHPKCLREKVFLWKANNYGCYTGNQVQHDCSEAWLCRECASPKTFGKLSSCPIHPNVFCSRYKLEKKFELEPVF